MSFLKKVAKQVAEMIKAEGSSLPDLSIEILKNAGSYENAVEIWSNQLLADLQHLVQHVQNLDKYAAATIIPINFKKQQEKVLQKCERFASRADDILIARTLQYTEISKIYKIDILDQKSKEKRDQSARALQHKFDNILQSMNNLASRLYREAENLKLIDKNKELFAYIQKLETLNWESIIQGFKQGSVPFRYEK